MLHKEGLDRLVCEKLNLGCLDIDNSQWITMVDKLKNLKDTVKIGLVGKYVELHDAYISVVEALNHGGLYNNSKVEIKWIDAENLNKENSEEILKDCNGIFSY